MDGTEFGRMDFQECLRYELERPVCYKYIVWCAPYFNYDVTDVDASEYRNESELNARAIFAATQTRGDALSVSKV